jgi:hypothetical protein
MSYTVKLHREVAKTFARMNGKTPVDRSLHNYRLLLVIGAVERSLCMIEAVTRITLVLAF